MNLAILKAGTAAPLAKERDGDYDRMFIKLLAHKDRDFTTYDVEHGKFPQRLDEHDLYLVTGSRYSAYDDEPWITQLLETIRRLHERRIPLVGVCFGHQAMALALGGRVARNPAGWEIGVRPVTFTPAGRAVLDSWLLADQSPPNGTRAEGSCASTNLPNEARDRIPARNSASASASGPVPQPLLLLQSHQDAVLEVPPTAENLACGPRTPSEIFAIGDSVLGVQGHPEFKPEVVRELIQSRHGVIPQQRVQEGLASLGHPPHQSWAKRILENFLMCHGG